MTEDDTFNILSKPTYYQMKELWIGQIELWGQEPNRSSIFDRFTLTECEEFFSRYGWTATEYGAMSAAIYRRTMYV